MPQLNRVILAGKLTRKGGLRWVKETTALIEFAVLVSEIVKDRTGTVHTRASAFEAVAFGDLALALSGVAEGADILVQGRLRMEVFAEKDGAKRTRYTLVVERYDVAPPEGAAAAPPSPPVHASPPGPEEQAAPPGAPEGATGRGENVSRRAPVVPARHARVPAAAAATA